MHIETKFDLGAEIWAASHGPGMRGRVMAVTIGAGGIVYQVEFPRRLADEPGVQHADVAWLRERDLAPVPEGAPAENPPRE